MSQQVWNKVELYGANRDGEPVRYTIADGAAVSRGTPCQLLDPRTASCGCLASAPLAGVAMEDHKPNKGILSISLWTNGVFDALCSGAISTVGEPYKMSKEGYIKAVSSTDIASAATIASYGVVLFRAFEIGADNERINVRLNI